MLQKSIPHKSAEMQLSFKKERTYIVSFRKNKKYMPNTAPICAKLLKKEKERKKKKRKKEKTY